MNKVLSRSLLLIALLFLAACDSEPDIPAPGATATPATIVEASAGEFAAAQARAVNALADEYVQGYFDMFPEQALAFGALDPDPARLSDPSLDNLARWQIRQQELLARLDEVDTQAITEASAVLTANFLRNVLESARDMEICRMELTNVSPTWTGWMAGFTELAGRIKMGTAQQRADALRRLAQIPDYIDSEIANLKEGVEQGYTAPHNSVRAVGDLLDAFLALPASHTPFVVATQEQDIAYQQEMTRLVESRITPAIRRYRDYLLNEYAAAARPSIGIDAIPDGAACYRASVRYWATVDLSAAQIHRIGLEQMERILAEMSQIGARSFGQPDPLALLQLVKNDPRYRFTGREEMVRYAEAALERAITVLPQWFGRVPKAPVVVEPYPAYQEKSAPLGQAVPAAADGSAPGKYLINTYQAEQQSKAGLEATAFHEAYPGHHTQFTIAQERTDLHPISRYFFLSGFGEGWALYAERLADEMGLYSSDLDRLGMLSNEAWRAARLVVDSGMHGLGWSREQALDYLDGHNASTRALNAAEIDRYIAVPGQATSYLLGALEIRRLRDLAQAELGDGFDIRAFHDLVLEDGAIPLTQLAGKVEAWIAAQQ